MPLEIRGAHFLIRSAQLVRKTLKNVMTYHTARTHTYPFNGPFSGTTRVGRYQKGKANLDFTEVKDKSVAVASAGPYASLHLAPDRQQRKHLTTQFFTGRMPFLPPNQQRQLMH